MFRAEQDAEIYPERVPDRFKLFNIPETITLYYNVLILELCRFKELTRQGAYAFIPSMAKLLLSIIMLSSAPLFAADAKQQGKPEVKIAERERGFATEREKGLSDLRAAGRSKGPGRAAAFKKLFSHKDPLVRGEAAKELGRSGDPAAYAELTSVLKSTDEETRNGAVYGLAALKDKRAAGSVAELLTHENRSTRWAAAYALGELKAAGAVPALAKAAGEDADREVRLAALEALLKTGGVQAKIAINGLAGDADPGIRAAAANALKELDRPAKE